MAAMANSKQQVTPTKRSRRVRSASDPAPDTSTPTTLFWSTDEEESGCDETFHSGDTSGSDNTSGSSNTSSSDNTSGSDNTPDSSVFDLPPPFQEPVTPPPRLPANATAASMPQTARDFANIGILGPNAVASGMPCIKTTHYKLRCSQQLFPPESCVFVGNLPMRWSDGMLTQACRYEFEKYGSCVLGVFRKTLNRPYAIVQYQNIYDAGEAVRRGNGVWMERPLRVEWSARARVGFY